MVTRRIVRFDGVDRFAGTCRSGGPPRTTRGLPVPFLTQVAQRSHSGAVGYRGPRAGKSTTARAGGMTRTAVAVRTRPQRKRILQSWAPFLLPPRLRRAAFRRAAPNPPHERYAWTRTAPAAGARAAGDRHRVHPQRCRSRVGRTLRRRARYPWQAQPRRRPAVRGGDDARGDERTVCRVRSQFHRIIAKMVSRLARRWIGSSGTSSTRTSGGTSRLAPS